MVGCCSGCAAPSSAVSPRFRKALWLALAINAAMFGVEIVAGAKTGSVSLLADAVDFAGDAANYAISLAVLALGLVWRARAALLKGGTMAAFGLFVLGRAAWSAWLGEPPEPLTMGAVGLLALLANAGASAAPSVAVTTPPKMPPRMMIGSRKAHSASRAAVATRAHENAASRGRL